MSLDLPDIGFGTSGAKGHECADAVWTALDAGYRLVDTAQMYDNEPAVGAGIRLSEVAREDIVLASKILPDNLGYEDAKRSSEESLERLGVAESRSDSSASQNASRSGDVDAVDLLYVHWPTGAYDPEESLRALQELHEEGVARNVGVSNFTPELLDEAREILDIDIAAHQVECHPLFPQDELRAYADEHGHTLVGYCPLGQGEIFDTPELREVAERHDTTVAAVCIAWAVEKGVVPIPQSTDADHIRANREATDLELTEEDVATIDGIEDEERLIDPDAAAWNQ
ncbi:aldo/keto reductase [Halolamina salifodinae]|uniref:2,5-diketo-D-gluconate reductase B n=1 Tax=Halolamina salifodinae TaxID=1202767 RepID=A0A8T4H181_9EURY|nr:aldo/keto reductase [Halolamina salifodinae]MBP1987345.1 2,5-diketo-D-gluconate reductase B [Halolamina salifodinae]